MTNTSILNVLDAIGKALETKDGEISLLRFDLNRTKEALAEAEAKAQELKKELHDLYDKTGTVAVYLDDVEMPIRPEVTE